MATTSTHFTSEGAGGLSRLSVWLIHLGITPERIEPGHPEQTGRHERMHRTLKEETARRRATPCAPSSSRSIASGSSTTRSGRTRPWVRRRRRPSTSRPSAECRRS
jgi:hypothetical protein